MLKGIYVLRNDLAAMVATRPADRDDDLFHFVPTQHRSEATRFDSWEQAERAVALYRSLDPSYSCSIIEFH